MKVKFHFVFIINKLNGVNLHDFLAHIFFEELNETEKVKFASKIATNFPVSVWLKILLLALQSDLLFQICIRFYEYWCLLNKNGLIPLYVWIYWILEGNEMKTTFQLYNFHNLLISNGLYLFIWYFLLNIH